MELGRKMRMLRWMCGVRKKYKDVGGCVESGRNIRMLRWMCGVRKKDKDAEVDVWS